MDAAQNSTNPRLVSRGPNLQVGYVGLDGLYLVIEYPHADLYRAWAEVVRGVNSVELRGVAQVHQQRGSIRRPPGAQRIAHPYPLSGLLFCAQCERRAEEQSNPMLRSRISGANQNGRLRYRHAEGVQCGCGRKSVFTQVIEEDFARLIRLLTIDEETLPVLVELAAGAEEGGMADEDFEAQKAAAIAKARRRVENARFLFLEGDISQEEYLRRKEHNERQIAHWEARTTESEKAAIELAMCMNALDQLAALWDTAGDEDRQQMARMLFEYVVYDLDRQQIVDFRLKPWADRYLVLRMELYRDEYPDLAVEVEAALGEKESPLTDESQGNDMPHRGLRNTSVFEHLRYAARRMIVELYLGLLLPQQPISHITPAQCERNEEIRHRHGRGESWASLAEVFGISEQRVSQIVRGQRTG